MPNIHNPPFSFPWQALVDTWLSKTGGSGDMEAAPQLLVALRAPNASGSLASAAAGVAGLSLGVAAVTVAADGTVLAPASGAFDVTVAPGHAVQAAVDACPTGGSVLLLPGTHEGPLVLTAGKVVHVFGRGSATLRAATGSVLTR